jgi:LPXTG-motif cell wall-anchored protein
VKNLRRLVLWMPLLTIGIIIAGPNVSSAGTPGTPNAVPVPGLQAFANCEEAAAAGFTNILRGTPAYDPSLDANNNGIACEASEIGAATTTVPAPTPTAPPTVPPPGAPTPGAGGETMTELPRTGVEAAASLMALALLLVGGALTILGRQAARERYIVVFSKTGSLHRIPKARRFG